MCHSQPRAVYLGIADQLKLATVTYTDSGRTGKTAIDTTEAVAVLLVGCEGNAGHSL